MLESISGSFSHYFKRISCGLAYYVFYALSVGGCHVELNSCRVITACVEHIDCLQSKGVFVDYMVKDAAASLVKVYSVPAPGRKKTVTSFRLLYPTEAGAMLEGEISDGVTQQIRASLAFHGMPIIGDGKYGNARLNRKTGFRYQRLAAFKLVFDFEKSSPLAYLNNATLQIPDKDINL